MYKNNFNNFLDGNLDPEQIKTEKNSAENDFLNAYHNLIKENQSEVPVFDLFAKIKTEKKKHLAYIKRFLPYAASILIILCSVLIYQSHKSKKNDLTLSEQEIQEIKEKTTIALLYFSQELNACMAQLDISLKNRQPILESEPIKQLTIEFENPLINLKFD